MISLTTVIECNAKGVASMIKGDYSAALVAFRQALDVAGSLAPDTKSQEQNYLQLFDLQEAHYFPVETQSSCRVFDCCFNLFAKGEIPAQHAKSQVDFVVAVVLYNIALACHQEGLLRAGHQTIYDEKAFHLYAMAARLLQTLGATRDNLAVLLAIANNIVCLSLERLDFESLHSYREWMGQLIVSNKTFHVVFFYSNFAATQAVEDRPAPAA